jgi:hypothetical protein
MQLFIKKFYSSYILGSLISSLTKTVKGKVKFFPMTGHKSPEEE